MWKTQQQQLLPLLLPGVLLPLLLPGVLLPPPAMLLPQLLLLPGVLLP
jgi:hypothetical protein